MTSAQELIEYAESIVTRKQDTLNGAEIRAAASRAYYGAYHACLQFETSLSYRGSESIRPGGVHEKLLQRLGNPDSRLAEPVKLRSRRLSALLRQCREERERADYHLELEYSFEQAKTTVIEARKIMNLSIQP